MKRVATTCIITCYDYESFVREAVDSALSQTVAFDEIIVVDDGSSDGTAGILDQLSVANRTVRIIRHERNAGQLAAFESAAQESNGDIVFFLDADDVYSPCYLASALEVYQLYPRCDFLFCEYQLLTSGSQFDPAPEASTAELTAQVRDLGLSVVRTLKQRIFLGRPTSCLSMRRHVISAIFPLPLHEEWRTRADVCLVYGASLAGARKFGLSAALVGYRMHEKNAYLNNPDVEDAQVAFSVERATDRLFELLAKRFGLSDVMRLAFLEFKTIPNPQFSCLLSYSGYVLRHGARWGRARGLVVLMLWYIRSRLQRQ